MNAPTRRRKCVSDANIQSPFEPEVRMRRGRPSISTGAHAAASRDQQRVALRGHIFMGHVGMARSAQVRGAVRHIARPCSSHPGLGFMSGFGGIATERDRGIFTASSANDPEQTPINGSASGSPSGKTERLLIAFSGVPTCRSMKRSSAEETKLLLPKHFWCHAPQRVARHDKIGTRDPASA
jgi:hypothetical protein